MTDARHHRILTAENGLTKRYVYTLLFCLAFLWLVSSAWNSSSPIPSASPLSFSGTTILYVVTTLSEFDDGNRYTIKGHDRLQETLIPVVRESLESMLLSGFDVDLFLVCHYNMTRRDLIQDSLPSTVGLEIWDNATPIGYKLEDKNKDITQDVTRALARQHRFVIKDKLKDYDFFVAFEDDMLITGDTIQNYMEVSAELKRLRTLAPDDASPENFKHSDFYGAMTKAKLQRIIPGFIRVEVLLDEENYGSQTKLDPVPVTDRPELDPKYCCHLRNRLTDSSIRPASPLSDQIALWETNIKALGVRKLPLHSTIDWVVLQRGPRVREQSLAVADYWAGADGYYKDEPDEKDRYRPDTHTFNYINNMGGWMASREQIYVWHHQICPGGLLPPYEAPEYNFDGLDMRNVEYWSGGLSIFTKEHGCNLQRVIPLDMNRFARSLLYHTANNKQQQLHGRQQSIVKVNDLLGELNTVRKNAEAEMHRRTDAINNAMRHV